MSSAGLATPWQLIGCHESDPNQAVFVQGVIFDRHTKTLSSYSPLVVDQGTIPAINPTPPTLPKGAIIALFGGGNDDATTLVGEGAKKCVNGADGHIFGQVFFCGTHDFWQDVNAAHLAIPHLGVGSDGQACPTVRSFKIVDQDQSDNVQTTYLVTASGTTAQNTAANRASLGTYSIMKNPSDNRVLSDFVAPALKCSSWMIPDLADNGALVPTQATNELQAAAYQANHRGKEDNAVALIPLGDPMTGPNNLAMVNAYRVAVDQPRVCRNQGECDHEGDGQGANTRVYCAHLKKIQPGFLERNKQTFLNYPSPVPSIGANLYAFMEARLAASFQILGCK